MGRPGVTVTGVRPGAVRLSWSELRPAGGGQVSDRGWLVSDTGRRIAVTDVRAETDGVWHVLDADTHADAGLSVGDQLAVELDETHRSVVSRLHTAAHLFNSLVFARFDAALVTGAQIYGDGVARVDFDVPDVGSDALRALEPEVNRLVARALPVRRLALPARQVLDTPGMVRSLGRNPPAGADGLISVVEIEGLDRQACGGTHVASTAEIGPIEIVKVDNRGRHNRRVRFRLVG